MGRRSAAPATLQRRQVETALRQAELAADQKRAEEAALRESSALRLRIGETDARVAQLTELASRENAALRMRIDETDAQVAQLTERLAAVEAVLARIDVVAQENLAISLPVALRRSARDIAQLRARIGQAPCTPPHASERERA